MTRHSLFVLVALTFCFVSCEDSITQSKQLKKMDIADAKAIYIAPRGSNGVKIMSKVQKVDESNSVLFKITEDGLIQEVTLTDKNGKDITGKFTPIKIIPVENSPYIVAYFTNGRYLVNKTTCAVYDCSQINIEEKRYGTKIFENEPDVFSDKYGNMYYQENYTVHKIDISDINAISDEILTPDGDNVTSFVVSQEGELLYGYFRDGGGGSRFRTNKGRLIPYRSAAQLPFCGLDGRIHFYTTSSRPATDAHVAVNFQNDENVSIDTLGGFYFNNIYNLGYVSGGFLPYCIKLQDLILAVGSQAQILIIDTNNSNVGYIKQAIENFQISDLQYNKTHIYCCGPTNEGYVLLQINLSTFNTETILKNDDYEIYSFTVDDTDNIIFNGLRLSDGKPIIASLNAITKNVTVLSVLTSPDKIILTRLQ